MYFLGRVRAKIGPILLDNKLWSKIKYFILIKQNYIKIKLNKYYFVKKLHIMKKLVTMLNNKGIYW